MINKILNHLPSLLPSVVCCLLLLSSGCTTVTPPKTLKTVFYERPKTPGHMTAFWNPYTQTNPHGDVPLRGVGGRILFYGEKDESEPIKVNGDVTVYLFDAHDPVPTRSVPIRHAKFEKKVLAAFYRKDNQDFHGYEFFVPVDELGNEEMDLQVVAVFHEFKKTNKTTALIYSNAAVVTLPGPKSQNRISETETVGESKSESFLGTIINLAGGHDESSEIVQASYQQSVQEESSDSRKRKAEMIQLPAHFTTAYQNDKRDMTSKETPEKTTSPYMQPVVSAANPPQFQAPENAAANPGSPASGSPTAWLKAPSRLQNISQRNSTTNEKPFRIDSNTGLTPDQMVYEEVSKSGRQTKVWVQ